MFPGVQHSASAGDTEVQLFSSTYLSSLCSICLITTCALCSQHQDAGVDKREETC